MDILLNPEADTRTEPEYKGKSQSHDLSNVKSTREAVGKLESKRQDNQELS